MREVVLDTETTGLNYKGGDRIIEIGCVETKNYVAIASEFQAMAHLPDVNGAKIFEPEPGIVYSWGS